MIFLTAMDFTLPLADPVLKFLIILLIILGAPLLLNKIRIPPLLGLIIAGAVIGPHGFNLVLRDSSIILSGTAGLLYIMFLAGLEIDMGDFKRNSLRSLTFGLYTFCVAHFGTAGQHVRFAHADRLPHYQQAGNQQEQCGLHHRGRNDDYRYARAVGADDRRRALDG